ncbi:unnamed protein product [Paramecium octaurelia]|uniref:Ubiquitin-conjugating enzyme E2 n=1 Tax=Paramecium octaurelia TaxID=43137 RepID=A0A8S1WTJ3_PAROT|nr:unnamed protein product [Paramecium octaurelia]
MSKLTLSIKYVQTQFKISFQANEKTIIGELKQYSVDRLSKLQKLVKIGFENIPLNFEATNYLLKDNQDSILDDDDLVLDLIKDNETIHLVFIPSLNNTVTQPQPQTQPQTQQQPQQQPQPQKLTSLFSQFSTQPQQAFGFNQKSLASYSNKPKAIPLQASQPVSNPQVQITSSDTLLNNDQLKELQQKFYLDTKNIENAQWIGELELLLRFIQATDITKTYKVKCNLEDSLMQVSEMVCNGLQLQKDHVACFFSLNGLPICASLNQMHNVKVSESLNCLKNKEIFVIITKCKVGQPSLPKIDSELGEQQIFIQYSGSKSIKVNILTTTVQELKQKVYHKLNIPTPFQQLIYVGKVLDNASTLKDYGIQNLSNIILTFKILDSYPFQQSYNYNFHLPWMSHLREQTEIGLQQFRSVSLVFFSKQKESNIMAVIRKVSMCNAPLVLACKLFSQNLRSSQLQCIAFEVGMQRVIFDLILSSQTVPETFKINKIFEYSRYFYDQFLNWSLKLNQDQVKLQERYRFIDSICSITLKKISNPAYLSEQTEEDKIDLETCLVVDYDQMQIKIQNNEVNQKQVPYAQLKLLQPDQLLEDFDLIKLQERETLIWLPQAFIEFNDSKFEVTNAWIQNKAVSNHLTLKLYSGIELKNQQTAPLLTTRKSDEFLIYSGPNKDVKQPIIIFNVMTGESTPMNPDKLAVLQQIGSMPQNDDDDDSEQNKEKVLEPKITNPPNEAIVVLLDISGSMDELYYDSEDLTRMGVVKAFFSTFADRTMAYDLKHVISLVYFDNRIIEKCSFTELFILFKDLVNKAQPTGRTNLYRALKYAENQLLKFKQTYPKCLLRIIALTDGQDNDVNPLDPIKVAESILKNEIFLDSFVVSDDCTDLKKITKATGGQCFSPQTIQEGLKLFEFETILSASIRKKQNKITLKQLRDTFKLKDSQIDFDKVPIGINLPNEINQQSMHPQQLVQEIVQDQNKLFQYASNNSLKRVIKEILNYEQHPHPHIKIFPCQGNVSFWKIILLGPEQTPYEGGVYILYLQFDENYPIKPPNLRFLTPIYHCNINSQGRICHSILDRNYTLDTTVLQIFQAIFGLLMTPEPDDPLDTTIASEYLENLQQYQNKAKAFTQEHAKKPLDEVITQIIGVKNEQNLSDAEMQAKIVEINKWIHDHNMEIEKNNAQKQ